ncbi:MAG TPA: hypothetical protein VFM55_16040 [Micromonosporaceae bacterium]|nr:hypothetical protein [Micromonosporaceae bacterium]
MALVEYADAAATPAAWWPRRASDPRATRAWASAVRWRGDGVTFAGLAPHGPFAALRRGPAVGGWSRMNAVEVCGGTFRGAQPPPQVLAAARAVRPRQLVAAAAGYACPVLAGTGTPEPAAAATLVAGLCQRAEDESASFAVLHLPLGSPLVPTLAAAGFTVGGTDLYPFLDVGAADPAKVIAGQPYHRRQRMRREVRAFERAGGRLVILAGPTARPFLPLVAELEARAAAQRGEPLTSQMAAEVNRRIFDEFGAAAMAVLVRDRANGVVACAVMVSAGGCVLLRTVGADPLRARPLGGYFQASFYAPLSAACAIGARLVLLGPGSLQPKLLRGAQLALTVSAAPRANRALCELLRHTDTAIRAQAGQLAGEFGITVRREASWLRQEAA